MSAPVFLDTNVLVYAQDTRDPDKNRRARDWIEELLERRRMRLSTQVLNEYYRVVTEKLDPGLEPLAARQDVRNLLVLDPVSPDSKLLESAWRFQDRYSIPWWDSLIVAAAQRTGAEHLLTEDFQDGQELDGVRVVDPFEHEPGEIR